MPRGFGRGFGAVWPYGPYGSFSGYGGYPFGAWPYGPYRGGRGIPFPFFGNFPWLPTQWWPYSPHGAIPYVGSYAGTTLHSRGYGYPYFFPDYTTPYGYPRFGVGYPGTAPPSAPTRQP